jgi:two-component system chemotaxis response regulator CheB
MKPEKRPIAVVVDADEHRRTRVMNALPTSRVIEALSLHDAYSAVEETCPAVVAIGDSAAREGGLDMFLRLLSVIGSHWFVYGDRVPHRLPPHARWVNFNRNDRPDVIIAALSETGHRPRAISPRARTPDIICIGASTGGVSAIEQVLSSFSAESPPTLIVQHIRQGFIHSMIGRLERSCLPRVVRAKDGAVLSRGTVYIAADDGCHLTLDGASLPAIRIVPATDSGPHKPSVDALFRSAAKYGRSVAAALLTGMGSDGAHGLAAIRKAGGFTVAQDRSTSTVFGMPRVAAEIGAAVAVLPLDQIAMALVAGGVHGAFATSDRQKR